MKLLVTEHGREVSPFHSAAGSCSQTEHHRPPTTILGFSRMGGRQVRDKAGVIPLPSPSPHRQARPGVKVLATPGLQPGNRTEMERSPVLQKD